MTPRFTSRTLMIAVFAASFVIFSYLMWRRSTHYALAARRHHKWLVALQRDLGFIEDDLHQDRPGRMYDESFEEFSKLVDKERVYYTNRIRYEEQLVRKYRRAAMFPWLPVDYDPPMPLPSSP